MDSYGLPVRCTQNPTISEEWKREWHPEVPAISTSKRSHLIVGAGPAGLECAVTLLRAGQKVTIADAADEAGGRATREARLPGLASWARVRDYRLHQISMNADADLFLSSPMSAELVAEFGADTVTLATGAVWRNDGVGSSNFEPVSFGKRHIVTPDEVMDGGVAGPPSEYIIYDDDHFYMGSAVAEAICAAGHKVIYATPLPMIATWTDYTLEQARIVDRLVSLGVELHPNTLLKTDGSFVHALTSKDVDLGQASLVFVGARLSRNDLYDSLRILKDLGDIHRVGDCLTPGIMQQAVYSGHQIARQILGDASAPPKREQVYFTP